MMKFFKQKNRGFTLVETLVALSILSVGIVAIMTSLTSGITNINYSKHKMAAAYFAQEGIEYIHNMRDNYILESGSVDGWDYFTADLGTSCPNGICPEDFYSINNSSNMIRKINILFDINSGVNNTPTYKIKVTSEVDWNEGGTDKSVIFSESLFNWTE